MKNNKILYLLTIFITLFTFNINANAAQELTCVYEKGDYDYKIILIQDGAGTREIWANDEDVDLDSQGWEKKYTAIIDEVPKEKLDSNGNLKQCPSYTGYPPLSTEEYHFFEELKISIFNERELIKDSSLDYVKRPTSTEGQNPDNDTSVKGNTPVDIDDLDKSKYQATCLYRKIVAGTDYHYVQIMYGIDADKKKHLAFAEYDPQKGEYSGLESANFVDDSTLGYTYTYTYDFKSSALFTPEYFITEYSGECPGDGLVVSREYSHTQTTNYSAYIILETTILTMDEDYGSEVELYNFVSSSGINPVTGKELKKNGVDIEIQFEKVNIENCTDLVGEEIAGYFTIIWNLIKIGVPIILIGFGTVDFVQAIFAGKEDDMKKAQGKFIKRIIIAAIIYLVPTLIGFLLKIANSVWSNIGTDICGIIF